MTRSAGINEEIRQTLRSLLGSGNLELHTPRTDLQNSRNVLRALQHSSVSVDMSINRELSSKLSSIANAPEPVLTSSGTAALHLALHSVGVGAGDRVLCPSISFAATANAILYCRAQPVFIDVEPEDVGISPERVLQYLVEQANETPGFSPGHPLYPKAIIAVSVFGLVPKLRSLETISLEWGIPLVIDAAGALGSESDGRSIMCRGSVAICSFNGNKIVTSGGGGAIFSESQEVLEKCSHLSKVAKKNHPTEFIHEELGFNYRMPALNAALLLDQLSDFQLILSKKRALHEAYKSAFSELPLTFYSEAPGTKSNYWLNSATLDSGEPASQTCEYLQSQGIGSRLIWRPLPKLGYLSIYSKGESFPASDTIYRSTLSFPSSYHLSVYEG